MATYSTIDALNALCTSVPDWNTRLDELNGQISLRQIELARLAEERSTTRSLRNKGSAESLRPSDGNENTFPSEDTNNLESSPPVESPKPIQNGFTTRPTSAAAQAAAVDAPLPSNSTSQALPGVGLTRQSSPPIPHAQPHIAPVVLRKRKIDCLTSGESIAPKHSTRSMVIVYYDSGVQTVFEEFVKFVSGSRNAMRKGKMAAKIEEMRRAAVLEAEAQKKVAVEKAGESLGPVQDSDDAGDVSMPKLRYVSTRNRGPPREYSRADNFGSIVSVGILGVYRRGGGDGSVPDISDELDKGLEWCQSQCENAAHQCLRNGECSKEIENIKRRLTEVKETAEKEVKRLRQKEAEVPPPKPVKQAVTENGKTRELKSVQIRKDLGSIKDLEVDDMEVDDDEGVDDIEPPKLIFKRSRDAGV